MKALRGLKKFSGGGGGGGPQSDYSVCPRPLRQFTQVKKFSGGWWWWVVHKVIIL